MSTILQDVADFFSGLVDVLIGLLIPATGTTLSPLQVVMWAGLVIPFISIVLSIIRRMASA